MYDLTTLLVLWAGPINQKGKISKSFFLFPNTCKIKLLQIHILRSTKPSSEKRVIYDPWVRGSFFTVDLIHIHLNMSFVLDLRKYYSKHKR